MRTASWPRTFQLRSPVPNQSRGSSGSKPSAGRITEPLQQCAHMQSPAPAYHGGLLLSWFVRFGARRASISVAGPPGTYHSGPPPSHMTNCALRTRRVKELSGHKPHRLRDLRMCPGPSPLGCPGQSRSGSLRAVGREMQRGVRSALSKSRVGTSWLFVENRSLRDAALPGVSRGLVAQRQRVETQHSV